MKTFSEYVGIKDKTDPLIEALAEIEHEQWIEWAKALIKSENLSDERVERWEKLFVPYDELSEEMKEADRVYAIKALNVMNQYFTEGITSKQIFIQGKALKILSKGRNDVVMELIKIYGAEFRKIIQEFESRLGRLPSPDDLIWVAGLHTGKDPRVVAKNIMKSFDSQ